MRPINFSKDGDAEKWVESFPYLGMLTHESGYSTPEISKRLDFPGSTFRSLRTNIWDSRLSLSTMVRLFRTYVLPVLLFGAETWSHQEGSTSVGCIRYELSAFDVILIFASCYKMKCLLCADVQGSTRLTWL